MSRNQSIAVVCCALLSMFSSFANGQLLNQTITSYWPGDRQQGGIVSFYASASSNLMVFYTVLTPTNCTLYPDGTIGLAQPGTCSVALD